MAALWNCVTIWTTERDALTETSKTRHEDSFIGGTEEEQKKLYRMKIILWFILSTWKLPYNQVHVGLMKLKTIDTKGNRYFFVKCSYYFCFITVSMRSLAQRPGWADRVYIILLIYAQVWLEFASCSGLSWGSRIRIKTWFRGWCWRFAWPPAVRLRWCGVCRWSVPCGCLSPRCLWSTPDDPRRIWEIWSRRKNGQLAHEEDRSTNPLRGRSRLKKQKYAITSHGSVSLFAT